MRNIPCLRDFHDNSCPDTVSTTRDCARVFDKLIPPDATEEHLAVIYLSASNEVLHKGIVAIGTESTCDCSPKAIYRKALLVKGCAAIVVAHNHPSGDPTPSPADLSATLTLLEAGAILDIPLVDHVVMGGENGYYVSIKDVMSSMPSDVIAQFVNSGSGSR
jgi:DNA repair protein RadC